jgi:hypothetical protein
MGGLSILQCLFLFLFFLVEEAFSPKHILGTFVKNQMAIVAWVCVSVFYSILLVFLSVFMQVPCYIY